MDYNNSADRDRHLLHTYVRKIVFEDGEGVHLTDINGKRYLDMGAGIAVNALGYSCNELADAVSAQAHKIMHLSNLYYSKPLIDASYLVAEATGLDKVFFTNSGTEAIEGALKLARKYRWLKNKKSRGEIIAMNNSFHGRTMGALSVTGTEHYRTPFEPLIGGVSFADYNDLESVKKLVTPDTCAIIFETIQGEGGIYPADPEFIKGIRKICDDNDIVMILDEIQCGMGRSGRMFCYEHYGVKPDIVTIAKAIGSGVPVGAFAASEKIAEAMIPGDHGTTYGGNPLAMAAVCEVFRIFKEKEIVKHVQETAPYLEEKLLELKAAHSVIKDVRGKGFMMGIELTVPAGSVVEKCVDEGLLVISAANNTIRIVPPLIAEKEDIDEMTAVFDKVLDE